MRRTRQRRVLNNSQRLHTYRKEEDMIIDKSAPHVTQVRRGRRPNKRAALLFAAALVAGLVSPLVSSVAPAAAAVPGLVRVHATSVSNAINKSVTVSCPANTRLFNAGGYVTNGDGSVMMDDLFPNSALSSVTVTGVETDAYALPWSITAVATCGTAPPGLVWVWAQSVTNSSDKSRTATCPAGKTLLGTGATIENGNGDVIVDEIKPNGGLGVAPTSVTVQAYEDTNTAAAWNVNALAICANPLPGQQRIAATSGGGAANQGVNATCPVGQVATGTGVEVLTAPGEIVIDDVFHNGSTVVAPTSTTVYGAEEDPVAAGWSIVAYSVCADA